MITAENVQVVFGTHTSRPVYALDNFNLNIEKGQFMALLGPNGAGKSTAMYAFLGLLKPKKGNIRIDGEIPEPGRLMYKKIGYLPEEPHYHMYLTVQEALEFYASLYGEGIDSSKIMKTLERVDLLEHKHMKLEQCSKGMKQRLGFAQAVIADPDLLFLDEPTRGLDPIVIREVRSILSEMHNRGTTIIINSHELSEVELVASHIAVIHKGKVIKNDAMKNLLVQNKEMYKVEVEPFDPLPDYFQMTQRDPHRILGTVPVDKVQDFMGLVKKKNVALLSCQLEKKTLEDVLFGLIKKKGAS